MKKVRSIFKKLEWFFLKEIRLEELEMAPDFTAFEVRYYEAVVLQNQWPLTVREAIDCVDFVLIYERNPQCFEFWPKMSELYDTSLNFLRQNTGIYEDPADGRGYYDLSKVKSRYEFKSRILLGYANQKGYVLA